MITAEVLLRLTLRMPPDALYNQYGIRNATEFKVRSLNLGVSYYFAIDAFNENGVTGYAGEVVHLKDSAGKE